MFISMPRFSFGFLALLLGFALVACSGEVRDGLSADGPVAEADSSGPTDLPDATDSPRAPDSAAALPVLEGLAHFPPVDEGASHPGLARFRDALLAAVERRDTSAVLAVVAPDILNTFGDDNGIDEFRRIWRLGEADSELWAVLGRVLRHGGEFQAAGSDTFFMAPYVYAAWPADHEPFEHVATIRADAVVRARPDSAAAPLGVLPYSIVPHSFESDPGAGGHWTGIELADGRRGWIANDDVHSPVGYRAIFRLRDGEWRMITLVAGD